MLAINSVFKKAFFRVTPYGLKRIGIMCKNVSLVTVCKLLNLAVLHFVFKMDIIMGLPQKTGMVTRNWKHSINISYYYYF